MRTDTTAAREPIFADVITTTFLVFEKNYFFDHFLAGHVFREKAALYVHLGCSKSDG